MRINNRRQRAFTLIEVLAAVAVLGIALAAIVSGMGRYASQAAHLRAKTLAMIVAHNRLTEVELEPGWPATGNTDGKVELGGGEWKWRLEVKSTPDNNLRRLDISVRKTDEENDLANLSAFIANTGR